MEAEQRHTLRLLVAELRRVLEGEPQPPHRSEPTGAEGPRPLGGGGDLDGRLRSLGILPDRTVAVELDDEVEQQSRTMVEQRLARRMAAGQSRAAALAELVAESAYGWANRLLALRCLEARGLRDEAIVRRAVYGGRSLEHHRFAQRHPERCQGEDDGLFEQLGATFAAEAERLPMLFDPTEPALALRPSVAGLERCLGWLAGEPFGRGGCRAPVELFRDPATLGWAYQFWHAEHKAAVFDRIRAGAGVKLAGADLVAATQLYTAQHLVRFLVQSSLGARWLATHPGSGLRTALELCASAELPVAIAPKRVREITVLDPACGSGHFLLEAFDLLALLYQEEGELTGPEEICRSILEHNLFGIDIDPRALQLAEAALWMKAAERGVELRPIRTNLVAASFELGSGEVLVASLLRARPDWTEREPRLRALLRDLDRAPELGALLHPDELAEELLSTLLQEARSRPTPDGPSPRALERALALVRLLGRRYDVVVTNPPYAGFRTLAPHIKQAIVGADPDAELDLYVAFLSRFFDRLEPGGLLAAVTPASWTTSARTVGLRRRMMRQGAPVVVAALGQRVFETAPLLFVALAVIARGERLPASSFVTLRPVPASGSAGLRRAVASGGERWPCSLLDELESTPLLPRAPRALLASARGAPTVGQHCWFKDGVWSGSAERDVREGWELAPCSRGWAPAAGGQGYARWYAPTRRRIRQPARGELQLAGRERGRRVAAPSSPGSPPAPPDDALPALEYSRVAGGRLSARLAVAPVAIAGVVRILPKPTSEPGRLEEVAAIFNSRLGQAWLGTLSSGLNFNPGYAARIPLSPAAPSAELAAAVRRAVALKRELGQWDPTGDDFVPQRLEPRTYGSASAGLASFVACAVRQQLELTVELLELEDQIEALLSERFRLPVPGSGAGLPEGAAARGKDAGLPAESALEAKARELAVAPRTLLELGVPGETERVAGDYLDVLLLRALGHRWPAALAAERGENDGAPAAEAEVPCDGIVPLCEGTGRATAVALVRAKLQADFPALRPAELERQLAALGVPSLESWVTRSAFERHARRFAHRPVLWQLASEPGKRRGAPAFACFIHAHALDHDTLPKLSSQLVQPLRQRRAAELERMQTGMATGSVPGSSRGRGRLPPELRALRASVVELARFEERLRGVIVAGFGHEGLARELAAEPLDRFCARHDGAAVPPDRACWLEQEGRYLPVSDDGIRTNLAPLQRAGLLARPVLAPKQIDRAIAERARWRARARDACRAGESVQPYWWPEAVAPDPNPDANPNPAGRARDPGGRP